MNAGELLQVDIPPEAGRDMMASGSKATGLLVVRDVQERQELVVDVSRRVGHVLVLTIEKLDAEWRSVLADLVT